MSGHGDSRGPEADETIPAAPDGFVRSEARGPFSTHNGPYFHARPAEGAAQAFFVLPRHCNGMGILHGWRISVRRPGDLLERPPLDEFTPQTRDLYVASGDVGFWQGALRDPDAEQFKTIQAAIEANEILQLDLLYGDFEGGQRVISRFTLAQSPFGARAHGENLTEDEIAAQGGDSTGSVDGRPAQHDEIRWIASVVRHWNVDRPDPR